MKVKHWEAADAARATQGGQRPIRHALALVTAAVLTACGGGGGGDTTSDPSGNTPPTETPAEQPADNGQSTGPAPVITQDSFVFTPDASAAMPGALDQVAGGSSLFAAWNPNDPNTVLKPGMKVLFFGAAQGCTAGIQGPLVALSSARLSEVASLANVSADASSNLQWTPSGNVAGCSDAAKARSGASSVFVNASDSAGAVALLTTSGNQSDGSTAFFGPFTSAGQNNTGANPYITGTFVNFRQAWWAADPLQPWTGSAAARLRSTQKVGSYQLSTGSQTAQAKQQMMATFLNTACMRELGGTGKPCQIQYMINTAIMRSGVTDWSTVSWFQNGGVWFDPGQGGIPIVDGPIKAAGTATLDETTGLSLFTSQGSATQHAAFSNRVFDITIGFDQLMNAVRAITARQTGTGVSAVTDGQQAAQWGSAWNQRSAWVLLSADVAQEVYNPDSARRVELAGGFSELLVGPQP